MTIHEFLGRLHKVKRAGNGWMALCPAHYDRKPSLHVAQGDDGKILVKCFSGCTTEQICSSLGLKVRDLFPETERFQEKSLTVEILAREKALPVGFLRDKFGLTDSVFGGKSAIVVPYRDEQGNLVAKRYRTGLNGKNRFRWEKGAKIIPYGLWLLNSESDYVVIVEGESDTWTLALYGFPTIGIPGKGTFKPEWSKYFSSATHIYIWQEPDASDFTERIQGALKRDVYVIDARKVGAKDPSDLHVLLSSRGQDFRAEFKRLLEQAELRGWTEPDRQPAEKKKAEKEGKESQSKLAFLLASKVKYFADNNNDIYAAVPVDGHMELWPVRGKDFKMWLVRRFFEEHNGIMNQEAIRQTVMLIESFRDKVKPKRLWLRVGKSENGKIYYDLADPFWKVIEISASGWRIVDNPLVHRRTKNMKEQVKPIPCDVAELNRLRKYIKTESFPLVLAWLVACLIPDIPHPVLILYGDKGSAKTTTMRMLRSLIDPAYQDAIIMPDDFRELSLILAANYVPSFDNLETLRGWQSDMLCVAATGGGIIKRELYTDLDEVVMSFNCATILTSINQIAVRDDLLDRAILLKLNRISDSERLTITELWQNFERDKPYVLGALFTLVSKVLSIIKQIKLPYLFRMADFTLIGYATSQVFYGDGDVFLSDYESNIKVAVKEFLKDDPVGFAIMEFVKQQGRWSGSASDLLANLSDYAKLSGFPNHPSHFVRRLNKIKSALRDLGISVEEERTRSKRIIHISLVSQGELASRASQASRARRHELSQGDANFAGASHASTGASHTSTEAERDAQNPPLSGDHNHNLAETQPNDDPARKCIFCRFSSIIEENGEDKAVCDLGLDLDYASCDRFQLLE